MLSLSAVCRKCGISPALTRHAGNRVHLDSTIAKRHTPCHTGVGACLKLRPWKLLTAILPVWNAQRDCTTKKHASIGLNCPANSPAAATIAKRNQLLTLFLLCCVLQERPSCVCNILRWLAAVDFPAQKSRRVCCSTTQVTTKPIEVVRSPRANAGPNLSQE